MSNGPLTFYFLWLVDKRGWRKFFPSRSFQVFSSPQADSPSFFAQVSHTADADQAESQSQKNELERGF